ncbi:MAG: hypothetical protein FJX42_02545 [Alphaproteobacteria bacterium]|nr:hypothetical protein [Alphaproteobacteria bacterium]
MTGIVFSPLVPIWLAVAGGAAALALLGFALLRRAPGAGYRAAAFALLAAALFDPRVVEETRESRPDVAVIAVDRSPSQQMAGRTAQAEQALARLRADLEKLGNLEIREVHAGEADTEDTRLIGALDRALAAVPRGRLAGALLLTDGQVHDVPASAAARAPAPVHALLTGRPDERDRRVVVDKAPGFALVGKETQLAYRIDDPQAPADPATGRRLARTRILRDGVLVSDSAVPVGAAQIHAFVPERAGPMLIEIETDAVPGELTAVNNKALVSVNAVRERLKVLLVSGQPHAGERTWRNILKSDPAVDLVHFTILRPPEKDDFTPLVELALIPFPVQELFEAKLKDFDLIVFDRYFERDIIPPSHFRNMEKFVRDGGAMLVAAGPEFGGARSLARTAIGSVLPALPAGRAQETPFRPRISEVGRRHPVTAGLDAGAAEWGRWFRLVETQPRAGRAVLETPAARPLLTLDRVDKGRVALFASDHIWLWARGLEGGGPHAEILRRLVHWLMKEPDLEEDRLTAEARGREIVVRRRALDPVPATASVTAPSGAVTTVELKPDPDRPGFFGASVPAGEIGVYRIGDGTRAAFAVMGALNAPEFADLRATAERLNPYVQATGGGVFWLANGIPDTRGVKAGRDTVGRGWMGLRRNEAFAVTGVRQAPLLPPPLALAAAFALLALAWWREGK